MPSKKEYDLVSDDGYDSRIPLHNEDAFQHGIHFQAKYIGTLDVPRPSSRVEIVAAMRRIRYEFKAKAIKKRKVDLTVSVDGVRVSINKKKKKIPQWYDENKLVIVHHPIYRIFYVSHDSQDLKIWSYIARDGQTNVFKCNVFKSYKKEQAMRIVRTIGQAFEVCHKLSQNQAIPPPNEQLLLETGSNQSVELEKSSPRSGTMKEERAMKKSDSLPSKSRVNPPTALALHQSQHSIYQIATTTPPHVGATTITSPINSPALIDDDVIDPDHPITSQHQVQLLQQQVEHHHQQTQVAVAQVQLLKEQLAAETAARIESQARTHQLLLQNRDLLDHMNQLIGCLQKLEVKVSRTHDKHMHPMISQGNPGPDATTPQCGPVFMPRTIMQGTGEVISPDLCMIGGSGKPFIDTDSPDSGHREMSTDSLALALQQDFPFLTMTQDQQLQYSFGFGSPVKIQQTSYAMTAVVNSNPFAESKDDLCDNVDYNLDCGRSDQSGDGRDSGAPKLRPPPEFRNLRNSQISEDSSASSNSETDSVKDGIVNFTDSDYYSHTGSSTLTNPTNQSGACYQDSRAVNQSGLVYRPKLDYHFNNFAVDHVLMQKYLEENQKHGSFSDEDNTESYDEGLTHPPSPPPPPSRLEDDDFDD